MSDQVITVRCGNFFGPVADHVFSFGHQIGNFGLQLCLDLARMFIRQCAMPAGISVDLCAVQPDRSHLQHVHLARQLQHLNEQRPDLFSKPPPERRGACSWYGIVGRYKLLHHGVNCSLSSNNILNPFTPFGDCSQMRMANLYANICQVGKQTDMRECFNMVTRRPAEMLRLKDYGITVGKSADLVVVNSASPEMAVAELTPVLYAFKRGRKTVSRQPAQLHRPQ